MTRQRSPARIICRAGRSFTEPPGFRCSAFANTETPSGNPAVIRRSWIGAVPPILVSMESLLRAAVVLGNAGVIFLDLDPKIISNKR